MPKQSKRSKAFSAARKTFKAASALLIVGHLFDSDVAVDVDDPDPITLSFLRASHRLNCIKQTRYFAPRGTYRKSTLHGTHWLSDDEFKRKYRVSREVLDKITAIIESIDAFKKGKRGRSQMPVKHQLMVLLQFLGKEGESNDSQRNVFKYSYELWSYGKLS